MKLMSLRLALQTTVFAVVASAGGAEGAGADPTMSLGRGNVEAKIEYCMDCHGPSGQGYRGFLTMPQVGWSNDRILGEPVTRVFGRQAGQKSIHKNGNGAWPQSGNAGRSWLRVSNTSIRRHLEALRGSSPLRALGFMRREYRRPMFRHVWRVTAPRLRAKTKYLA